jgi:hypothetical protein
MGTVQQNRKNGKLGGRPRGSFSQKTLDAMKVRERIKQRTLKVADLLFESQLSLARGAEYLFRIDKEFVKTGANKKGEEKGFWRNKKPVLVTSPDEMRQYLEDEIVNGDAHDSYDESASYYYLSARDPMNQAIDSMQDRSTGKVSSSLEVNVNLPKPIYASLSAGKQKQLSEGLPPKKVKAVVIHEHKEIAHGDK